jgi:hypothetical protein
VSDGGTCEKKRNYYLNPTFPIYSFSPPDMSPAVEARLLKKVKEGERKIARERGKSFIGD